MLVEKLLESLSDVTAPALLAVPIATFSERDQCIQSLSRKTDTLQHILWDFSAYDSHSLSEQLAGILAEAPEDLFATPEAVILHLINTESIFFQEISEKGPSFWELQETEWESFYKNLPCPTFLWAQHGSLRTLSQAASTITSAIQLVEAPQPFSLTESPSYQEALSAIQEVTKKEDPAELALQQHEAGVQCAGALEWHKALHHFSLAAPIWAELEDPQVCRSYNNIAGIYHLHGELDLAASYYQKTLSIAEEEGNSLSHAQAGVQLGHILAEVDSETAMEHYAAALAKFEDAEEEQLQAEDYLEMANIQIYISEFDEAVTYLRAATAAFTTVNNKQGLINSLRKLASIYEYKGKLELATKCYKNIAKLMEASNEAGDKVGYGAEVIANTYQQVASLELKQKNVEAEFEAIEKALAYAQQAESPFLIASLEDSLASVQKKKEKKSSFLGSFFNKKS
ncbi:MAG: tetratricopeptide repeat protein [Bacteroidota bacterium]